MNIQFVIQTVGYMVAIFSLDGKNIKIGHSSAYGDNFQELLNELFQLYKANKEMDAAIFPFEFEVKWYDDRVNYSWRITSTGLGNDIVIRILELSPVDPGYQRELILQAIEFGSLFNNIYDSLDYMLKRFGLIGYKNSWEVGNFPISEYLLLKADIYCIDVLRASLGSEDWIKKIPFRNELNIFLSDGIQ
ncbi:hypothetical protein [Chitinophaga eiseniae]|uniref:Uncharacterized protein n=1 Tax=Chitinophaga eiseniae TaxID=634771 RepID=A0A847SP66_9BACT|nr:hypothetical protein [Chitinophaga eiseniae]NLR79648.1 hypothetical protein [Chitinophaga eiseniae]